MMHFCLDFYFLKELLQGGSVDHACVLLKYTLVWTSLPNLWAFSPVSRIEIVSGIILETSFNNNGVFLSFSVVINVLLLLYLYFMFRFFYW